MKDISIVKYDKVARIINLELKSFDGMGLRPRIESMVRGTDGNILILNEDAYDLAQYKGRVQDLLYTGMTFVVGDDDFYLEPFDSSMTFKLAK